MSDVPPELQLQTQLTIDCIQPSPRVNYKALVGHVFCASGISLLPASLSFSNIEYSTKEPLHLL